MGDSSKSADQPQPQPQPQPEPQPEPMDVDVDSSPNDPPKSAVQAAVQSSSADAKQNEMADLPLDPELVGLPDAPLKAEEDVDTGLSAAAADPLGHAESKAAGDTDASKSAAGLMALAGGALRYLPTNWPPESPDKQFPSTSTLPSLSLMGGSDSSRDGKHTTLPPLNSITVLADAAAANENSLRMGEPSRPMAAAHPSPTSHGTTTAPSPPGSLPAPPASASSAGNPDPGAQRRNVQHLTVQELQRYRGSTGEYTFTHHPPLYPPIKDTASPQATAAAATYATPSTAAPNSANLFAQGPYPHQAAVQAAEEGRDSESSEVQYSSDQTTPKGADNGVPEDSSHPSPQALPPPPPPPPSSRGARAQTGPVITGGYKCEFEGCKAQPFQTQYLLK